MPNQDLKEIAKEVRRDVLQMCLDTQEGHVAPCFSCVDILVSLYFDVMGPDDKFILSKGHAAFAQYCCLRKKGFNPTIRGHPDMEVEQGVHVTTGSLGHGLPLAVGMAYARKVQGKPGKIYVLLGDGEAQEGTTWESLNLINKFQLDNLSIIVDYNRLQALDKTDDIHPGPELDSKFKGFGMFVMLCSGHDFEDIKRALRNSPVVIAYTVKGKGLSFAENNAEWHNKLPNKEQLELARKELN
jgi:transketolase